MRILLKEWFLYFKQWDPTVDPESPIPSLIPWQGPFHVSLNGEESTVLLFRPLFEKLYKALFGRNKVQTTTPRITLCTLYDTKNKPFCMLMLHSNRSSKAEVFLVSGPWGEGLTKIICFLFTLSLKCSTQNFQITTFSCEIRCCQTDQSHTKLWHLPRWHLEDGR